MAQRPRLRASHRVVPCVRVDERGVMRQPMCVSLLVAALLSLLALTRPLASQVVTGIVVEADSTTPLASAIVTATDARGATAARALTGQRGEFHVALPRSGRYALTVLRIGYQPTHGPVFTVAD